MIVVSPPSRLVTASPPILSQAITLVVTVPFAGRDHVIAAMPARG
jgi:hypothetical protein